MSETQMTMSMEEQEVRRRWEQVEDYGYAVIVVADGTLHRFMGYKKRWPESYTFTLAHAKKIAELREEIRFIDSFSCVARTRQDEEARKRILTRLESALKELLKGYKES